MLLRCLAVFSLLSGVLSEITSHEVEYNVDKAFGEFQFECVDVGVQGTLTKIAIDANMQMTSFSWASDFFIAVYDPVNETGRQVGGENGYQFKSFITDIVYWDSSLDATINGNVASYVDINSYAVKSTDQVCYGNGFEWGGSMTVDGKIVLTLQIEHTDPPSMQPTTPPSMQPTLPPSIEPTSSPGVEYAVDNKVFEALEFECVDVGAHGTLNKIAIEVHMQMPLGSWASDFFIAVYDPDNDTGRQVGGDASYSMQPFITDKVSWDLSLKKAINGNVTTYVNINVYTVKSTYRVCYGNGYEVGESITVNGKFLLSSLVDSHPTSPPSVEPTHSPMEVEYDVGEVFGGFEYKCVGVGAYGTLTKIAIDVTMQMTSPSWASDFFIAVHDPVAEAGRQVGGYSSYAFKPYITNITRWDDVLKEAINGDVVSYVDIIEYPVKSTDLMCYGNGYQHGTSMTVTGKIMLFNLVEGGPINPTMDPTHSSTMEPTHSSTMEPSHASTTDPTHTPTMLPTYASTMEPTHSSTMEPSHASTTDPTHTPTMLPTYASTMEPTLSSTMEPSHASTTDPTHTPTMLPTYASTMGTPESCMAKPKQVGNGVCNKNGKNNVESCMWDGGDCCEQSCVNNPNPKYVARCGRNGYQCLDPAYASSPTAAPGQEECTAPKPHSVGNGVCNHNNGKNNVAGCGWDGGDCCEESCLDNPNPKHVKRCGMRGYHCLDPAYAISPTAAPGPAQCLAKPKQLGNGVCNKNGKNNKAECGWDGGDCCEVSCLNNPNPKKAAKCGNNGYQCLDPLYAV